MLLSLERAIRERFLEAIRAKYDLTLERLVLETPPSVELGEIGLPVSFDLARRLRQAPRKIAEELAAAVGAIEGVRAIEVAGNGYINLKLERAKLFLAAHSEAGASSPAPAAGAPKHVVEHTNINPNKAAHIGHLRNAALGDSFVRLLRFSGRRVEVQNYIDNTGVQVADVVVGFQHLEKKNLAQVRALMEQEPRFDYFCWELYARVTEFYDRDPDNVELRNQTLKAIEEGAGEAAALAEVVSTAIVRAHLGTMWRLGVAYDLLPRESEILGLKFWEAAFAQLKQRGVAGYVDSGRNKGCWVMRPGANPGAAADTEEKKEFTEAKILVRSNGTATYVAKDIGYQLWKFGLLDREFAYAVFHTYPDGHRVWMTRVADGDPTAPAFGHAAVVYNVIDARQAYLQQIVKSAVAALGYEEQAKNSVHLLYEIVGLSPNACRELGIPLTAEDAKRPFVEVSGRRGLGVKADDLLDMLLKRATEEVVARHPQLEAAERDTLARQISIGALRYFLLKYTRNVIIAFDFREALNFEGETGPYCQYAVVRAQNIFRKLREAEPDFDLGRLARMLSPATAAKWLEPPEGNDFWELALTSARLPMVAEAAVAAQEPALVAKYAFGLAQRFNLFYHKHHILHEADRQKKLFLLMMAELVAQALSRALDLLGIEVPERM